MFKNLKSLFVVEEEQPTKVTQKEAGPTDQPESVVTREAAPTGSVSEGKVDEKFLEVLFKAMENNNAEGFDYLEFKQSLQSLQKMPMDEATRYQSAYAMAETMGATPQGLLQTAAHYLKILETEEQKFEKAVDNQRDQQINHRLEQHQGLQKTIQAKQQQIEQLKAEIEGLQAQADELMGTVEAAKVKVESTKNDFIASYEALVAQIKSDIEKMQQYLK